MITVYTRKHCAYCPAVKKYLKLHGREFIEKEADSYEGAQESLRISGVVTVPVVIIKDKIIRGYNIREISEALGLSTARA